MKNLLLSSIEYNDNLENLVTPSDVTKDKIIIAKGDIGATKHCIRDKDRKVLNNVEYYQGSSVTLPNNATIRSTEKGTIPLNKKLLKTAQTASILPGLESSSLISLGQLCDDDCKVLLDKKSLFVIKKDELILRGYRNKEDLLWDILVTNSDLLKYKNETRINNAGLYAYSNEKNINLSIKVFNQSR